MTVWLALACGEGDVYIVEGVVVEVRADEVVLDHEPIAGLMDAMIMPFDVADPALLEGLSPGDRVTARYRVSGEGSALVNLRVTGHGPAPQRVTGPAPVRVGEVLPAVSLPTSDGGTLTLGPAQTERVALTFVYTRCPQPEFCPAMTTRLQELQAALGDSAEASIVAVTLDPLFDTPQVLAEHARAVGAGPRWRFARLAEAELADLALSAGLPVLRPSAKGSAGADPLGSPAGAAPSPGSDPGEISHGLRLLVLDRGGALIERYDDANFPTERVVRQLTTGEPKGDPAQSGTLTPR